MIASILFFKSLIKLKSKIDLDEAIDVYFNSLKEWPKYLAGVLYDASKLFSFRLFSFCFSLFAFSWFFLWIWRWSWIIPDVESPIPAITALPIKNFLRLIFLEWRFGVVLVLFFWLKLGFFIDSSLVIFELIDLVDNITNWKYTKTTYLLNR